MQVARTGSHDVPKDPASEMPKGTVEAVTEAVVASLAFN